MVFLKGDAKRATYACEPVEFGEIEGAAQESASEEPEA